MLMQKVGFTSLLFVTASVLGGCLHSTGGAYGYRPASAFRSSPPPRTVSRPYVVPGAVEREDESPLAVLNGNRYSPNSLANPYGAGSPYKTDGLLNPYSRYGSQYSPQSWRNPYATDTPRLYDSEGNYRGKLSTNRYDPESISNPYGKYGSRYSPVSINNPYGAGNPYLQRPIYVVPPKK